MKEDFAIYRESNIYPPTHMIVMSKTLDEAHPAWHASFTTPSSARSK